MRQTLIATTSTPVTTKLNIYMLQVFILIDENSRYSYTADAEIIKYESLGPLLHEEYSRFSDPGKALNNHKLTVTIMVSQACYITRIVEFNYDVLLAIKGSLLFVAGATNGQPNTFYA